MREPFARQRLLARPLRRAMAPSRRVARSSFSSGWRLCVRGPRTAPRSPPPTVACGGSIDPDSGETYLFGDARVDVDRPLLSDTGAPPPRTARTSHPPPRRFRAAGRRDAPKRRGFTARDRRSRARYPHLGQSAATTRTTRPGAPAPTATHPSCAATHGRPRRRRLVRRGVRCARRARRRLPRRRRRRRRRSRGRTRASPMRRAAKRRPRRARRSGGLAARGPT